MKKRLLIITGQEGVGKTTTTKELVSHIQNSAAIDGEDLGHINPWKYEKVLDVIGKNILSVINNN